MSKRLLLFFTGVVVFIVGYIFVYNYLNSIELTINSKNIQSLSILESGSVIHTSSGQKTTTTRVPKFSTVVIEFTGKEGYEESSKVVKVGDIQKSVTITPYFSKERLVSLIDEQKADLAAAIKSYHHDANEKYSFTDYTLYHFGDWASVRLVWKGVYGQNTDDQKVILKKQNGVWSVAGEPSILFFYKNYETIPVDILKEVNNS